MKRSTSSLLLLLCLATPALCQPLTRDATPEPLRPWIGWTLYGHEEKACPFFHGQEDHLECTWPSRLTLDLADRSGKFSQEWLAHSESWVELPGDASTWPLDVRLDGAPAVVVARDALPVVRLPRGRHTVSGGFIWDAVPPLLNVPAGTGLLHLTLRGRPVPFPARDEQGRVWLEEQPGAVGEESRLEITVLRHLLDEVPLLLTTRVELAVSGESREERLGRALPDGFVPVSISGGLPARIEANGHLRVQVRPGQFMVEIVARHQGPAAAVARPAADGPWDAQEVWVFEARPDLRLVSVEGITGIDPQQTTLPDEWKMLPAYLVKTGEKATLVEKRRGDSDPAPDRLTLRRTWWLDFDGHGGTVHDAMEGSMSRNWRLEMQPPAVLGRITIDGKDQFITRLGEASPAGVEVRQGTLHLQADSRYEGTMFSLPAVGWDEDFHQVSGTLNLGPGWRLLHASGVDDVSPTWISSWTLLDIFLVLVLALSVARLWDLRAGAIALVALGLTWIEPGAPRWTWVAVIACEALVRVFPEGGFRRALRLLEGVAIMGLTVIAVPFMIQQVRAAIYPSLEEPFARGALYGSGGLGSVAVPPQYESAAVSKEEAVKERDAATFKALGYVSGGVEGGFSQAAPAPPPPPPGRPRGAADSADKLSNLLVHDPRTVVQTGPGLPNWNWREVMLRWRGPVERGQRMRLFLVPPWVNFVLAFLRVGLVLLLGLLILHSGRGEWSALAGAGAARTVVAFLIVVLGPGMARAEIPSNEVLDALRARLLAKPECFPECASSPRLLLEATESDLRVRIEILSAAETAVPLPGGGEEWPGRVLLDGTPAPGLSRDPGEHLWMVVGPGIHQVIMEGRLPNRDAFEIPLPLRPHQVLARTQGWRLLGLQAGGRPEATLQLVRERAREGAREPLTRSLEPGSLPPFLRVERDVTLGLRWQTRTRLVRAGPAGSAVVIEVPLLEGESVTTPEVRIKNETAFVNLAPSASEVSWESQLAETPEITLRAPEAVLWTEIWRVAVGATWHAEAAGIPIVHRAAEGPARLREWRPWPGETVTLRITRPPGVPGRTLTIDRSSLTFSPGLRSSDASLEMLFRSSRGGEQSLVLPEGAVLQSVSVNGTVQPLRLDGRRLTLPVSPGAQRAEIVWREPRGISTFFRPSVVDLGEPSVNNEVAIAMPADRWTHLVGGPRLGPAVKFWSFLAVALIVSIVLGRSPLTPLRWHHWFLLSLGLSQSPLPIALLVALTLFALGARGARGGGASTIWFDVAQILLAGMVIAALVALFWSIQRGLLGPPEMQITGNGSSARTLRWYQDRVTGIPPRPWVLSVPLLFYRLAMLLWSLWLAVSLLTWLRWGWASYSEGGIWRRLRKVKPPSPPIAREIGTDS